MLLAHPGYAERPRNRVWINRYRKQLVKSISPQFLEEIIGYMRKRDLLTAEEAGQVQEASSLSEQVKVVMDLLAGKGSHASQSLQTYIETTNSQLVDAGAELGQLERLTNLLLVEGLTDIQQKEHDVMQIEATKGMRNVYKKIPLEKLFLPLSKVSIPPRISVTVGAAGIGKSTLVKLFVYTWAKGELNKDTVFVLPLTFRELNTYEKLSAERLIRSAFPHITEPTFITNGTARTLLILDGLDEFKTPLDFSNTIVCTDPKKEIQVDSLITNIIRGNLFPEASIWVTSRPTVANQIPGGLVDRMTEIRGFGAGEIEDFLNQMFLENKDLSSQVLSHLKANRSLYTMCTVPAFCWIAGSSMGYFLKNCTDQFQEMATVPKTLSEIYSYYFKMALSSDWQEKQRETPRIEQTINNGKKIIGNLGRLAFYGLLKRKYVFYEQDIKAYGADLSSLQGSLCNRILLKEDMQFSTVYYFSHLTLQEFLAATYYYASAKRAIFDLFTESGMSWPKFGFLNHFKNAIQRSLQSEDGQLDIFVRFLSGLLSPQVNKLLSGWLLVKGEHESFRSHAISFLQSCLNTDYVISSRTVNIMQCLYEVQHMELAKTVEEAMKTESLAGMLTPVNCSVLAYLLQVSEVCLEETNLSHCLTYHICKSLLSQLLFCTNLRLDNNNFKDNVMELLGSVLSVKDCQIQKMSLAENQISNKGAKALARSLMVNRSLMVLDLRSNSIGPKGAKALADALKINQVLLSLNLQKNSIGPQGAKQLSEALKQNGNLRELILSSNCVGDTGSVALAEALRVNHSLTTLDLQSNSISNKGVTALIGALFLNSKGPFPWPRPSFRLQTVMLPQEVTLCISFSSHSLQWNFIQSKAAKALAQALQFNTTHLSASWRVACLSHCPFTCILGWNRISVAFSALCPNCPSVFAGFHCSLRGNSIGVAGAKAMANALKVNRSLRVLNLQENSLGMDGAICIATALTGNHGLTYVNLQGNRIGQSGAKVIADAIRTNSPHCVVEM
uniref:NLR family CARD domain containing 3 n=1 Tax=Pelusios castaneus TaxID=367368 RepID=A0A8C8SRS5_9SAUR